MALVRCLECGRDVSDQAAACPSCGAPVDAASAPAAPDKVSYSNGEFIGTPAKLMELAKAAIARCDYRVDSADAPSGAVTFTTGMTMGSWSGVSGTVSWQETAPYRFKVTGQGKQNVRGGQVLALNLFDEANAKARNVIEQMQALAGGSSSPAPPSTGCALSFLALLASAAGGSHLLTYLV